MKMGRGLIVRPAPDPKLKGLKSGPNPGPLGLQAILGASSFSFPFFPSLLRVRVQSSGMA